MALNTVRVRTSRQLRNNLQNISRNLTNDIKRAMIETALTKIETVAKQTLTREGHVDTGRLRASIHTRYGDINNLFSYNDDRNNYYNGSLLADPRDDIFRFEIFVGTNVEYAGYIERRFPYLIPAFESSKNYLARRIRSILRRY